MVAILDQARFGHVAAPFDMLELVHAMESDVASVSAGSDAHLVLVHASSAGSDDHVYLVPVDKMESVFTDCDDDADVVFVDSRESVSTGCDADNGRNRSVSDAHGQQLADAVPAKARKRKTTTTCVAFNRDQRSLGESNLGQGNIDNSSCNEEASQGNFVVSRFSRSAERTVAPW